MKHITPSELAQWQRNGQDFALLDVRRASVRADHAAEIAGAQWLDPAAWLDWKDSIGASKPVVLYCAKGHEIGQALTTALTVLGADARYLVGGMQGWLEDGLPVQALAR
jgi:thiosulfate sulfurtransferase